MLLLVYPEENAIENDGRGEGDGDELLLLKEWEMLMFL